jgi:CBS domain-containing protein
VSGTKVPARVVAGRHDDDVPCPVAAEEYACSSIVRRQVPTVREHSPITLAVDTLVPSGLGSLPLLDGSGLLTGVVSEGDLLRFAVGTRQKSPGTQPHPAPAEHTAAYRLDPSRHVVSDAMTCNPVTATEQQPVEDLARLFVRLPWRTLPVVRRGRLVGVITRTDVVEALLCQADAVPPLVESPE